MHDRAVCAVQAAESSSGRGFDKRIGETRSFGRRDGKSYLDQLLEKNIVRKKIIGRSHICSYNLEHFFAKACKVYLSLLEISESGLVAELLERYKGIISIMLYGSVARGEDNGKSDIDLLIIARTHSKISGLRAGKMLGRELTLIAYTLQEWRKKAREDKGFYDNVMIDGIALHGSKPAVR